MQKNVFFSILKFIHIHSFCVCVLSRFSHVQLLTPWTVACQAPLSVGFSRQEYWSTLIFTILILPIHEHGIFLYLFVSSLISFFLFFFFFDFTARFTALQTQTWYLVLIEKWHQIHPEYVWHWESCQYGTKHRILEHGRRENKLYLVFWYIRKTCLLEIRPSVLVSGKLQYLSRAPI